MREPRKTVALRPGAAAYTPAVSLAASNPCLNCATNVQLRYCPECGQEAIDPDPTLRELLRELASELLHWDGKLATTVTTLARHPGALTAEYLAGRRVRFVSPLRLYLAASVLYFFVIALVPQSKDRPLVKFGRSDGSASAVETRDGSASAATTSPGVRGATAVPPTAVDARDSSAQGASGLLARLGRRANAGIVRAEANQAAFTARMFDRLGALIFVILPAFALALGVAYRKERRHYPQHLVFALHVHSVVFIALIVAELTAWAVGAARGATPIGGAATIVANIVGVTALAGVIWYIVAAMRTVYGGGWGRTVAKTLMLSLVYMTAFIAGLAVLLIYTFLTF